MQVIAVTGSVGKTTTKEFIATLLEGKFRVAKTPGNSNSQVGVPLSVLNMRQEVDVFIVEMGMSQPREITRLVNIIPPDIGVVTKIGLSHAAFFPEGLKGIATAKAEIFSHPRTKIALINRKDAHYEAFSGLPHKILFGDEERLESPFPESHLIENFSAAVAVARQMRLSDVEIRARIPFLHLPKMRFEKINREGITFINDAYNASPESLCAALSNLPKPAPGGKRIAVFGEMKELGSFQHEAHQEVAVHALSVIDHMLCYGEGTRPMIDVFFQKNRPAELFDDLSLVRARLTQIAQPGDVVLLKGSNSNGLWRLLEEV